MDDFDVECAGEGGCELPLLLTMNTGAANHLDPLSLAAGARFSHHVDSGQKNLGKTVRMFLADGTPGGLQTAEIMNWTGHIVAAPRSDLARLLARREVGRTGVYVLIGEDLRFPRFLGGL
ncbi:hypothetical protein [Nocardia farcinica]|uniref:hypothetical protein n=1 Tax=Nocardia farcinica TaxID=37329 RepID=UPI001BAE8C19|nr:hypothetical protein [Nocardia farcinica]